jgi:Rhodopirellula transposase DDE domain
MAISADVGEGLAAKLAVMRPHLGERQWRLYLGSEARALGRGGIVAVARAAGVSELTVSAGVSELEAGAEPMPGRSRRPGGGRKKAEDVDPGLAPALEALVDDSTRGDPVSPLKWTTKSLVSLAGELTRQGHGCRPDAVLRLLHQLGYSTQGNSRTIEGRRHPDRDGQFRYINERAKEFLAAGSPVISVDAKKKEQVGQYAQQGREWRAKGDPVKVRDHDFPDEALGKVTPYGIYDVAANTGFVNVGTDHDTAAFAVESIRRWWQAIGEDAYPGRRQLLVTCDAGGSNSYRNRAWKAGLADLARQTGLEITVCHFPPGTSKWNKIEHRLFSQITRNWRGRPLVSCEVIISTIAAVTTATGLTVTAVLDDGDYPEKVRISDKRMQDLEERVLGRHGYHGEWNYTIRPAPAGPDPEPPPPPGPDLAALAALAGIGDFPALLAALAVPWQAAREQRLHLARGHGRRKHSGGGPRTLPFEAIVAAAACHLRLGMHYPLLGKLLGAHDTTISLTTRRITPLLAQHGITRQDASTRISTLAGLREHAAAAGLTLTLPAP